MELSLLQVSREFKMNEDCCHFPNLVKLFKETIDVELYPRGEGGTPYNELHVYREAPPESEYCIELMTQIHLNVQCLSTILAIQIILGQ